LIVNRSAAAAEEGEDEDEDDEEEEAADGDMGPLSISDANREPACFGATADASQQSKFAQHTNKRNIISRTIQNMHLSHIFEN
jgi:hypothetical protein